MTHVNLLLFIHKAKEDRIEFHFYEINLQVVKNFRQKIYFSLVYISETNTDLTVV